jgi:Putative auto-transporter adhesin, head GIN domain
MKFLAFFAPLLLLTTGGASASALQNRTYSVTDFDRIRVIGPFIVDLTTGKSASAEASGSNQAIDRIEINVQGRMLIVRANSSAWGGWPGKTVEAAHIAITVPMVRAASVEGSGSLNINRLSGLRVALGVTGAGSLNVAKLDADQLDMTLEGGGNARLAGTARTAIVSGRGSASLDAKALVISDLNLHWQSAGSADFFVKRSAKGSGAGAGNVTILGKPACAITAGGVGLITCGASNQ